jgi:CelD/BcsL family acetyltransferase involved in cellulose biosynthesis
VFLTHEWLLAAWQWRGRTADLCVLVCEDAGELVGALPLARPWTPQDVAGRALEFLAIPDTQQADLLVAEGHERRVAAAIADRLVDLAAGWDLLRLRSLRPEGALARALLPALASRGIPALPARTASDPWVRLDGDWSSFYAARSRRLKKAINLASNRLAKAGTVAVDWLRPGTGSSDEVRELGAVMTLVSSRSWKTRTPYSLDRPGPQAFLRALLATAHARGWLSVWTLKLDGKPLAFELQLVQGGDVYALRSDFDPDFDALSPGSHLARTVLEGLFGHGYRRYLMGPGDNAYKYRWNEGADDVVAATVYSPTLRGRTRAWWDSRVVPVARRWRDGFGYGAAASGSPTPTEPK